MNATADSGHGAEAGHPPPNAAWWRKARSLKVEIAVAFGTVIALTLALGLTFYLSDLRSSAALDRLLNSDGRMADLTLRSELAMAKAVDDEDNFVLSVDRLGTAAARERYLLPMQSHLGDAREYLESVRIISSDAALREQIAGIDQQMLRYEESVFTLARLLGTPGQVETLQQADDRFAVFTAAIESSLEDVHTAATKRAIATRSGVEQAANIARWTVFVTVAFTSLIGAIVAVIVWRRINGSVAQLITFSGRVAAGDFSARAPQGSEHEFAILAQAMNQMAQSLENSQAQLLATARRAGMAEIATNVLHNVGNILNSVNVSAGLVVHTLRKSKANGLSRAVGMMNERAADLGDFLTDDAKGKQLPAYLNSAARALMQEQQGMLKELGNLTRSIDHIKDVVATQQSYAGASAVVETVQICDLAEDAVR
ncbi:MAG: integral rane sensor signal transduction histidine kinase, partial [Ramlibacter sp.]|nr:integral rane sensor signal transduction histidine kinase [Ramlibacter sp.]